MLTNNSARIGCAVAPVPADLPAGAGRALWLGIVALALVYMALFAGGTRVFVLKTAILPLFLLYALMLRQRADFIRDWLPLLSVTVLFDVMRGVIYVAILRGYQTYYVEYVITLERAVVGLPAAPLALQPWRTPMLDTGAVLVHASHFAYFLLFGLVLWHARRRWFPLFRRALVLVMAFGLLGYALVPTAPPWLAAQTGVFSEVAHVVAGVYTLHVPELYGAFDTNPVAAMPSLHVAFPVMCALVGWRSYGRAAGIAMWLYALTVAFMSVYLGEHYAVDAIAGALVAALAVHLAHRVSSARLSFKGSLGVSGVIILLAVIAAVGAPYLIPDVASGIVP